MQHPVHVRRAVRTSLALQQLALVRLAVRARNQTDTLPVNPTYCQNRDIDLPASIDLSYLQRSSSCPSTTRMTPATCNDRPAAFNDSTDLSYLQRSSSCIQRLDQPQLPTTIVQLQIYDSTIPATDIIYQAEDTNTTTTNLTYALVNTRINCHLCYICYLAFVFFIVFGCHYSHTLT